MFVVVQDGALLATYPDRDDAVDLARRLEGAAPWVLPRAAWVRIELENPADWLRRAAAVARYPEAVRVRRVTEV